jgi:hypothetical protein
MSDAPPPLIILVHGTYASNALWTHPESSVCKRLRHELGENCEFHKFLWDGENRMSSRQRAASELTAKLDEFTQSATNRNLFVLAHSHGGNIALHALAGMVHPKRVKGVVTLGTPFLRTEQRDSTTLKFIAASYALWICILVSIFLAILLSSIGVGSDMQSMLMIGIAAVLWIVLYIALKRRLIRPASEDVHVIDPLKSVPKELRILSLRHGLDEASTWLTLLAVPRMMEYIMSRISERSVGWQPESSAANQALNLLGRIPYVQVVVAIYFAVCYLPPLVYIFLTAPMGFVGSILLQHRLGLGGSYRFSSLRMYLSVQGQTWVGTSEYRSYSGVLGMIRAAKAREANSPHSMGYSDPKAINDFCSWIAARQKAKR